MCQWATCCTAFFSFSEFTVPSQKEYDSDTHLSLAINSRVEPFMVRIHIKQSKTDPFRQHVHLSLGKSNNTVCPSNNLLSYLFVRKEIIKYSTPLQPYFNEKNWEYMVVKPQQW